VDLTLSLTASLPRIEYAHDALLVEEGGAAGGLWVLESGTLEILRNGTLISTIERPGALIGEISLLLGRPYSATVRAATRVVARHAANGVHFLEQTPALLMPIATTLAERLTFVTDYLADLKNQYGDAPGLSMVPDVLRELSERRTPPARPGSRREPDPEY